MLTKEQQDFINERMINYIVANMLPLDTVNNEEFRQMISAPFANTKLLTKASLRETIVKSYTKMTESLINSLNSIKYTCTAFDIWSSSNRSCLGTELFRFHYFS